MDMGSGIKDLNRILRIWELRKEVYEKEKEFIQKCMSTSDSSGSLDYSSERVTGGKVKLDMAEGLIRLQKLDSHIHLHNETIKNYKEIIDKIKSNMKQLEGIDYKVVYLRDVEGKTLEEIADELGYSVIWIKKVSAKNKKLYT
ncbi:sigma factor-like helix-turn-helix DNA-binding protein [Senegalia massiliensis]|uniref:Uncharacterized protein n=1 Tax=Senegalia massiliensis TaxID=1720316 RepID=A0A845R0X1_9CLOT|nr:hypothetical protein [Senegalia massiliensis]NBI08080.1 hypothetical protein [Senegalia massiliensis]